jgi:HEAT repeat protein
MRVTLVAALIAIVAFFLLIAVIRPRLETSHRHRANREMETLRDRVKRNPSDQEAVNAMVAKLYSTDAFEQTAAAAYLGQIGHHAAPAVNGLASLLSGPNGFAAREAALTLGEIGPGARQAIPVLLRALRTRPNEDVGWFAAESLGKIATSNDTEVIEALKQAAKSSDVCMRSSAEAGLVRLRVSARP